MPDVPPDPPKATAYLWRVFADLHATRPVGMAAGAIPWAEIDAWQRVNGPLDAWETDVIRRIDAEWLAIARAD